MTPPPSLPRGLSLAPSLSLFCSLALALHICVPLCCVTVHITLPRDHSATLPRAPSLSLALSSSRSPQINLSTSRSLAQSGGGVGERARQRVGGEHVDELVGGAVGWVVLSVHSCVGERAQKRKIKQDEKLQDSEDRTTGR